MEPKTKHISRAWWLTPLLIIIVIWGLGHSSALLTSVTNSVLNGLVAGESTLSIERVEGSVFSELRAFNLKLASASDSTHIVADSIEVSYGLMDLFSLGLHDVRVKGVNYVLRRRPNGDFIVPTFAPSGEGKTEFSLDSFSIQRLGGTILEGDSTLVAVKNAHVTSHDLSFRSEHTGFTLDSLWIDLEYPKSATEGSFRMNARLDKEHLLQLLASAETPNSSFEVDAKASMDSLSLAGSASWLLNASGTLATSDLEPFIPGLSTSELLSFQAETKHADDSTWVQGRLDTRFSGNVTFNGSSIERSDSLIHHLKLDLAGFNPEQIYPKITSLSGISAIVSARASGNKLKDLEGRADIHLTSGAWNEVSLLASDVVLTQSDEGTHARVDLNTSGGEISATGSLRNDSTFELDGSVRHVNLSSFFQEMNTSDLNVRLAASGAMTDGTLGNATLTTIWLASQYGACEIAGGTLSGTYTPTLAQLKTELDACSDRPITSTIRVANPTSQWKIHTNTEVSGLRVSDLFEMDEPLKTSASIEANYGKNERLSGSISFSNLITPSALLDSVAVRFSGSTQKLDLDAFIQTGGGGLTANATVSDLSTLVIHSGTLSRIDAFRLGGLSESSEPPSYESRLSGTFSGTVEFGEKEAQKNTLPSARLEGDIPRGWSGKFVAKLDSSRINRQLFDADLEAHLGAEEMTMEMVVELAATQTTDTAAATDTTTDKDTDKDTTTAEASKFSVSATMKFNPNTLKAKMVLDGMDLFPFLALDGKSTLFGSISANAVLSDTTTFDAELNLDEGSQLNSVPISSLTSSIKGSASTFDGVLNLALADGSLQSTFEVADTSVVAHVVVDKTDIAALLGVSSSSALSTSIDIQASLVDNTLQRVDMRIDSLDAEYEHVTVNSGFGHLQYTESLIKVDSLRLDGSFGSFFAHGFIPRKPGAQGSNLDFKLNLNNELSRISQVKALEVGMFSAEATGRIEGPFGQSRLSAAFSISDAQAKGVIVNRINGRLLGELDENLALTAAELVSDAELIEITPAIIETATFSASYDGTEVLATLESHFQENRDLSVQIAWMPFDAPSEIALLGLDASFDGDVWSMTGGPVFNAEDATLSSPLVLHSGDQRIVAISSKTDQVVRNLVTIQQLKIDPFADLLTYPDVGGVLGGTLTTTSTGDELELQGTLSGSVRAYDKPVGDINLQFSDDGSQTRLNAGLKDVNGESLQLSGSLPRFDSQNEVQIQLSATSYSIDWIRSLIDPDLIDELKGKINGEVKITGTPAQPNWEGLVRLQNGAVGLPVLGKRKGMVVTNIQSNFRFNGEVIEVDSLRAKSGDGWLRGSGTIDIQDLQLGEYNIALNASDFKAIDSPDYFAVVSGQMTLGGTTDRPKIGGRITVHRGDFWLSDATTSDAFEPLALSDEDLNVLQRRFGLRIAANDTTSFDAYHVLALEDFTVRMERDTWIRSKSNPRMDIQLTGDLDVQKQPKQDPKVYGSITVLPDRSRIIQFGKRFELDRGELTFNGPMKAPNLNMEASYTVPSRNSETEEVTIRLIAQGRPDDLDVSFDSDPAMELADIVSYIATGRPASASLQITGAQSEGYLQSAAGLAIGPVADLIEDLAGTGLGLDVIEIEHTGLSGVTLTAGKYVSPRLYVSVSQPISLSTSSESSTANNKNQTQVTIEYELVQQLLLSLLNRGTILRINLRWQHAF